jgi:type II secretory pathway component GspD/PulD (secretin)
MKIKLFVLAVMGMLLSQQSAMPQTGTDTNAAPANPDTNAPMAVPAASAPAAVASAVPVAAAPATEAPAATAAPADTSGTPSAETNATPTVASIPLIEFQDVPLTVAIENLARQAGINYLLDPKIAYGQPDQSGQIKVEPTLSIRWENVTAEQALLALLNNYDLQLVEDPQTKIGRITMKDPTAPPALITRVIQLKYASVSNLLDSVQAAFTDRRSHVYPDSRTSQLVVVSTAGEQDSVDMLVKDLDKPTRQVLIEAKLVEVSSTPSTTKGVNWAGTLENQNVNFGNGLSQAQTIKTIPGAPVTTTYPSGVTTTTIPKSTTSTTIQALTEPISALPGGISLNTLTGFTPAIGFLSADGVQAVLSFLNQSYDAQTLSTPRIVTLDNEPATISVTRQFPVINVTASTAGVSSGSSTITYSNVGTVLQVTPRITANDYIWLKVVPDVSSFFATITKVIAGSEYQADEFDARHIETQVMIPNGNTLVMGGLIQDNPTASYTTVPVLGSIPILGWAFKSQSMTMDKDNLVIFITPTIVKDDDYQPATTDFLNSRPAPMKEPMNPNNIWDKAESDWSNPTPQPGEFSGSAQ